MAHLFFGELSQTMEFTRKIKWLQKATKPISWHKPCSSLRMKQHLLIFMLVIGLFGCGGSTSGSSTAGSEGLAGGISGQGFSPGIPPLAEPDAGETNITLAYLNLRLPFRMGYDVSATHFAMTAKNFAAVVASFQISLEENAADDVWNLPTKAETTMAQSFNAVGRPQLQPAPAGNARRHQCDLKIHVLDAGNQTQVVDLNIAAFENLEKDLLRTQFPGFIETHGENWMFELAVKFPETVLYFECDPLISNDTQNAI